MNKVRTFMASCSRICYLLKVYILIIFTGGNNEIKTAYEYEWVKK